MVTRFSVIVFGEIEQDNLRFLCVLFFTNLIGYLNGKILGKKIFRLI